TRIGHRIDLQQGVRVDQVADRHQGRGRAGVAEERLARLPYHGLVADVGQVEGDLDDVGEIGATGPQAGAHVFEGLHGLPLRVADSDDLPVFIPGDHARYINEILDLEGQGGGAAEIGG